MSLRSHVRIAHPSEEETVMELCRELHRENGIFTLDEPKVREMLQKAFKREGGILGVVGAPGKLEGIIYMLISSFWYSKQPHLEELFVFVRPEYRTIRTKDGNFSRVRALADFAKWCSDETGFPLVIGVLSDERTEGKVRLYQRFFGKPIGNFFYYETKKLSA